MSEDDIRTKVVYCWLAHCGLDPAEISVEIGFEIRLGRSTYRVGQRLAADGEQSGHTGTIARPRADILVRRAGKSLLVVEVKAPDEPLNDEARDQGISYARLLPNIAPFVVLTNGKESQIFDSVTREAINGELIPSDHPTVKNGFRVSADALFLRAEALELFVSLSADNLHVFCERQTAFRMSRLRGDKPESGKKYIPVLYVERPLAQRRLMELLEQRQERVIAVVGRPQVGKTNFLCHVAEDRLSQRRATLFYPAACLTDGLLRELMEDFGWALNEHSAPSQLVAKLVSILRRAKTSLVLFVDGWNEADVQLAHAIDLECERLASGEIQIVISFTHSAASRLLVQCGNPTFIADRTSIGKHGASLLAVDPEAAKRQGHWSVVTIEQFDDDEKDEAYKRYSRYYQVRVPENHAKTKDPYLLSVAMRRYARGTMPALLDEPDLIEEWLTERVARLRTCPEFDGRLALAELGRAMHELGAPLPERRVKERWGLPAVTPIPQGMFESALLMPFCGPSAERHIDFYNGRDRDFVIATWALQWLDRLRGGKDLWHEFSSAAKTNAGLDALFWFFRNPEAFGLLLGEGETLPAVDDTCVLRALLSATGYFARRNALGVPWHRDGVALERLDSALANAQPWVDTLTNVVRTHADAMVRIEALKALVAFLDEREVLAELFSDHTAVSDLVPGLLEVHSEFPLAFGSAGMVVLEAIAELHWQEVGHDNEEDSRVLATLIAATGSQSRVVREGAYACWAFLTPYRFLSHIVNSHRSADVLQETLTGAENAAAQIEGSFYGEPMCPSPLEGLKGCTDLILLEHNKLRELCHRLCMCNGVQHIAPRLAEIRDTLWDMLPPSERESLACPPHRDAPGQKYLFEDLKQETGEHATQRLNAQGAVQ